MDRRYIATFHNFAERAVDVAVEPWAMGYDIAPKEKLTIETFYMSDSYEGRLHVSEVSSNSDRSITLTNGPALSFGPNPGPIFPTAVRITLPDRVETFGNFAAVEAGWDDD